MDRDTYPVTEIKPLIYSFVSVGPKGQIKKIVAYQATDSVDEYNLALLDETAVGFSDLTVTANNDMDRVLATVIQTIDLFFDQHPKATLIFTGSDSGRTRLYRAVIGKYIDKATEKFDIYGVRNDDYERFVRDRPYESFIIRMRYEN
jgi:hypothetical protein